MNIKKPENGVTYSGYNIEQAQFIFLWEEQHQALAILSVRKIIRLFFELFQGLLINQEIFYRQVLRKLIDCFELLLDFLK